MATYTVDESQRTAARVAGFAYLITTATVVYANFGIHDHLIVANNAETAQEYLGARTTLSYRHCRRPHLLRRRCRASHGALRDSQAGQSRPALLAAFWRLLFILMWLVMTLNLFDALRLLDGADYLQAFEAERLQALASLYLGTRFDYYYVGLPFGALASTACGYLGSSPAISLEHWLPLA